MEVRKFTVKHKCKQCGKQTNTGYGWKEKATLQKGEFICGKCGKNEDDHMPQHMRTSYRF